jgi:hypothetical protein
MAANPERQLARLRARFYQKACELPELGFLLKGTLLQRFKRCSSAGCGCHDDPPRLHGPYWQWTAKVDGKTITQVLSEEQVERYREWMDSGQRFEEVARELFELSAQAGEVLRTLERQAARPTKTKQKKQRRPSHPAPRS